MMDLEMTRVAGKKENLVYILHNIETGGVEVALLSAIPALCRQFNLAVVVLGRVHPELIAHFSEPERTVFKEFNFPLYSFPFKINAIISYITSLAPDKVISSLWRASLVGAILKKRLPKARFYAFIHSTKLFHAADASCTRLAVRRADCVFVDAVSTGEFVKRKYAPQAEIRVISFLTHNTPEINPRFQRPINMMEGEVRFLFLGRIFKVKNLPEIIVFIKVLRKEGINAVLDVYGRPGDDYQDSLTKAKSLGLEDQVQFKGEIHFNERFSLFPEYDFLIQFSSFEGMAMSVAEAMQNGLVPVVTPVGEIPNYAEDGKSAIFVNIADESARNVSAKRLEEVIREDTLYRKLSENAFKAFYHRRCYAESLLQNLLDVQSA